MYIINTGGYDRVLADAVNVENNQTVDIFPGEIVEVRDTDFVTYPEIEVLEATDPLVVAWLAAKSELAKSEEAKAPERDPSAEVTDIASKIFETAPDFSGQGGAPAATDSK